MNQENEKKITKIYNINMIMCIECEDVPAVVTCETCDGEVFCLLCYNWTHKKGNRLKHVKKDIPGAIKEKKKQIEGTTEHFSQLMEIDSQENKKKTKNKS